MCVKNLTNLLIAILLPTLSCAVLSQKVHAATQQTFYVSTTGSDTNAGTFAAPFLTITKARDVVRTNNGNMSGDIIVKIRGGNYYLSTPITFTEQDSGTNGYNVLYENYATETPNIVGGRKATGWVLDSGKVFKLDVGTTHSVTALYENGVSARYSRYPDYDYALHNAYFVTSDGSGPFGQATTDSGSAWFEADSANPIPNWDLSDARVDLWGWFDWHHSSLPVTSFDVTSQRVNLSRHPFWGIQNIPIPGGLVTQTTEWSNADETRFAILNIREKVNKAGRFSYNSSTGFLYYYPRCACTTAAQLNSQEIIIPEMKNVIEFKGVSTSNLIHNITLKGLTVRASDFSDSYDEWFDTVNYASRWIVANATHYENVAPEANRHGLIYLTNAEDIVLSTLDLYNSGWSAVFLDEYSRKNVVFNSNIHDVGYTGVYLSGTQSDNLTDALISTNNLIQNNHIHKFGHNAQNGVGIMIQSSAFNLIDHNSINDGVDSAIRSGGSMHNSPNINLNRGNLFSYNKAYNVTKNHQDMGVYYNYGGGTGNVYDHNYADASGLWWGIQMDDSSYGWVESNNIIFGASHHNYQFNTHYYPSSFTLTNNTESSDPAVWTSLGLDATQMGTITMTAPDFSRLPAAATTPLKTSVSVGPTAIENPSLAD